MKEAFLMTFKKVKDNRSFYLELVLFLVLGFLIGAVIKTEAVKRVTIGFSDYQTSSLKQDYDFIQIQKDLYAREMQSAGSESSQNNQ